MVKKWKKAADKGKHFAAFLANLSKEFNCLPHDLIIGKVSANEFSLDPSGLIDNYLLNKNKEQE